MALKDTMNEIHQILNAISDDLPKAARGNKTASQRIRIATLKLEKIGKNYRKESVAFERSPKFKRAK